MFFVLTNLLSDKETVPWYYVPIAHAANMLRMSG